MRTHVLRHATTALLFLFAALPLASCGGGSTPNDTNLLVNGSFESQVRGIPEGWRILNFRGLEGQKPATYGIDDTLSYDGTYSFRFEADEETERFYMLSQEVEIRNAKRVRIKGAIKTVGAARAGGQFPQANFALTFYDKDRNRFKSVRFYDKKTIARVGSTEDWIYEERGFRVPKGTRYVVVHCVLGMKGRIWFDDVYLDVPSELGWQVSETKNFVFHSLPERPYPEGSKDFQQKLYENYAARLGVGEENLGTVLHYLYPDSAMIKKTLGIKTVLYVNWDDKEVHTINPVDNHEIVHILTHGYGVLPIALAEGTAYYMIGDLEGQPIQPRAQELLQQEKLPPLSAMLDYVNMGKINPAHVVVASASFVGYLIEFGGPERFLELHRKAHHVDNYDAFAAAFEEVYGGSLTEAEAVWREMLRTADFSKWQAKEPKP